MTLPLCVRIDADDVRSQSALLADGWREIEVLVTLANHWPQYRSQATGCLVSGPSDAERIMEIAALSTGHDRLSRDPAIPKEEAVEMRLSLIRNALRAEAHATMVYRDPSAAPVKGFLIHTWAEPLNIYRSDRSWRPVTIPVRIVFMAVDPAYRREGIGYAMVQTLMAMYCYAVAGTQEHNEGALGLYGKFGLEPIRRQRTFHK